jgi:hypothetical protein
MGIQPELDLLSLEDPLEGFAGCVLGVLYDLIPILVKDLGVDFLTSADIPVDGTKHSIVRFKFDPIDVFDKKLRSALRAKGFNLPDWDFALDHDDSSPACSGAVLTHHA